MAYNNNQPVIIIKRIKKAGHAHHGGAWKVAYADFVTAMMAFFLLLWLLNATTDDQRKGISDYFAPASVSQSSSGAGGVLGGRSISQPGAMTSGSATPSIDVPLTPSEGEGDSEKNKEGQPADADNERAPKNEQLAAAEKREKAEFDKAAEAIREAVQEIPELRDFANNLIVDHTPEGLRIQIVDQEGRPMFPIGEARMYERTKRLMAEVTKVIAPLPNKVEITGHTDALPFRSGRNGYGNWELSSDRALESRRVMIGSGLTTERITRVAGRASEDPLVPEDPNSARNRRISITVLKDPTAHPPPERKAAESTPFRRSFDGPRVR